MKYICLGYIEENKLAGLTEVEQNAFFDECFAYDRELQANGNMIGGEALQGPRSATTVRWQNGRAVVSDGPYAETKEHLGGIMILEAADLNHAIQLMSKHPGVRLGGPFEIRPAADLSAMVEASRARTGS